MNNTQLIHQIALTFLQGIGPIKASLLVSKLGSVEAIFKEKYKAIHAISGIGIPVLSQMKREEALKYAEGQLNFILKHNIQTHFYLETNYPRRLKQCVDAPLLLYSKGNFDPNPLRVLSIVGTRMNTEYGKSLVDEFLTTVENSNIQVVSGMAYGIDICAHQLCVKKNIQTVGILGHGLDRMYPAVHRRVAEQMFEHGGLMTEFVPGTKPDRENFPMRNRIVAGMSDATIVVESKSTGGSLITAELANDYNRDVFAFPGNVGQQFSEGCNMLIQKNKAQLITSGADFLKLMNWENDGQSKSVQRSCFVELNEDEKRVCQFLEGNSGEHIDVLSFKAKIPISALNVQLFHLEMKGVVKALPGKKYSLI